MIQKFKTENPIPSCEILELEYENGKWYYIYGINTPEEISNEESKEFIVYGHISNLVVKYDDLNELSVNIHFKTLDQYIDILNKQRQADLDYRVSWLSRHPKCPINTVILENRSYKQEELQEKISYLSTILMEVDDVTIFAAVK